MNKTLWMTVAALALVATAGLPTAAACDSPDAVVHYACNPGDAWNDGPERVAEEVIDDATRPPRFT